MMKSSKVSFGITTILSFHVAITSSFQQSFLAGVGGRRIKYQHHAALETSKIRTTILFSTTQDFSSGAKVLMDDDPIFRDDEVASTPPYNTWQESLEAFLNPITPLGKKQVLLSDLVSGAANGEIRDSLETALKERTLDPLLTPTGRRLQSGTKAVARQITNDILPFLVEQASSNVPVGNKRNNNANDEFVSAEDLPRIGSRIFDAVSAQAQKQFEQLQSDLADPTNRIPKRLSEQTDALVKEARNIFQEVPEGLKSPPYEVVGRSVGSYDDEGYYELRQYEGYRAASTSMVKEIGEASPSIDDLAASGAAFNSLASYLFGANVEKETLEMTTPVATTSEGEMTFYLYRPPGVGDYASMPTPLEVDDSSTSSPVPWLNARQGRVEVIDVAPALLAVQRFTGFVTDGEVARQKDALLSRLQMDDRVELDVAHGAVVPHIVLQYNPPYTLPIVRRNEIAVPVRWTTTTAEPNGADIQDGTDMGTSLEIVDSDEEDVSPSDG